MEEKLIDWSIQTLHTNGFQLQGAPISIKKTPWSSIYLFHTTQGKIYLKQTIPPFHLESKVIHQLHALQCDNIPFLISKNDMYNAFLMHDDGFPLREQLKKSYHPQYATNAITKYQHIQKKTSGHTDLFISLGIPDWRVPQIPHLFKLLLKKENLLINDGLTIDELNTLHDSLDIIQKNCDQIQQWSIPSTIEHGDFHDNNILIKDRKLTILDWGDSLISHPFFSLTSFIWSAKRNHALPGKICEFIEDDYLKLWKKYGSYEDLKKVYHLIKIINPIKFSLSFSRIANCSNLENMGEFKGRIASALRYFLLHQKSQ